MSNIRLPTEDKITVGQGKFQGGVFGRNYHLYTHDSTIPSSLIGPIMMTKTYWGIFSQAIIEVTEVRLGLYRKGNEVWVRSIERS